MYRVIWQELNDNDYIDKWDIFETEESVKELLDELEKNPNVCENDVLIFTSEADDDYVLKYDKFKGGLIMYTEPKVNHYKLVDYFDVWGNEEDGWEVNDLTTVEDDIVIAEDSTDEEIIDFLIQIEYLKPEARENVHLESYDNEMIEIVQTKDDYPIGRLEMIV